VADRAGRVAASREEIESLRRRADLADLLATRLATGAVPCRLAHNDAKIANVLFDAGNGQALCVVDLDTTMPGFAPHDFGDLVRSAVSESAEDEPDLGRVRLRLPVYRALARGFLAGAGDGLSRAERSLLVAGALVIVYEQAIRFLADYLNGDRYYRTTRPGHNLDRTRTQLRLLELLEAARPELERTVAEAG